MGLERRSEIAVRQLREEPAVLHPGWIVEAELLAQPVLDRLVNGLLAGQGQDGVPRQHVEAGEHEHGDAEDDGDGEQEPVPEVGAHRRSTL